MPVTTAWEHQSMWHLFLWVFRKYFDYKLWAFLQWVQNNYLFLNVIFLISWVEISSPILIKCYLLLKVFNSFNNKIKLRIIPHQWNYQRYKPAFHSKPINIKIKSSHCSNLEQSHHTVNGAGQSESPGPEPPLCFQLPDLSKSTL